MKGGERQRKAVKGSAAAASGCLAIGSNIAHECMTPPLIRWRLSVGGRPLSTNVAAALPFTAFRCLSPPFTVVLLCVFQKVFKALKAVNTHGLGLLLARLSFC